MKTVVWVRTSFSAFHRWKDAPAAVAFLRDYHRHVFHVELAVSVTHADRDVEFFTLKEKLDGHLLSDYAGLRFDKSCEMIASELLDEFGADSVTVSEDGENGATVTREPSVALAVKKSRCFVGIEAEGPRRGLKTLFVPGSSSPKAFAAAFSVCGHEVEHVYYGAGNDREFRSDTYTAIRAACEAAGVCVTVETDDPSVSTPSLTVTLLTESSARFAGEYAKVVGGGLITWVSRSGMCFVTRCDDPLFSQDRDL